MRPDSDETGLIDIEVREDGGIRLFCGRATDVHRGGRILFGVLVAGLTRSVVYVATEVANTTSYLGAWDFGVAVSKLRGIRPFSAEFALAPPSHYSADDFRQTTRCSYEDLIDRPDEVVDRLLGQLGRALNADLTTQTPNGL